MAAEEPYCWRRCATSWTQDAWCIQKFWCKWHRAKGQDCPAWCQKKQWWCSRCLCKSWQYNPWWWSVPILQSLTSMLCNEIWWHQIRVHFCNMLCLTICIDSSKIPLHNKFQNSKRVCFVTQRVKVGLLEVAAEKAEAKSFEIWCID